MTASCGSLLKVRPIATPRKKPVLIWMLGNAFLNAFLSLGPWNVFLLESSIVCWRVRPFLRFHEEARWNGVWTWHLDFISAELCKVLHHHYMQYNPHIVDMHMHTHSTLFLPIQVFEGQTLSTRHYSQWFISYISTSTHCKAQRALEEGKGSVKKCSWNFGAQWWRSTVWS